jgi:NodT family efflux transporter outer membrane factor (OMF) lipoprotein
LIPLVVAGLASLAACAPDLGPAPKVRPMSDYGAARTLATFNAPATPWPAEDWWKAYNDPQLTSLIEQALKISPDLKAVEARVRMANAQAEQAGSALLPTLSAKGSIQETGVKLNFPNTPAQFKDFLPTEVQPFTQIGANLSYQIDFWGKNRAAVASASSAAQASAFELAAARLQLSTAVATAYADLIRTSADYDEAVAATKLRDDSRNLVGQRVNNGLETKAEYSQSAATREASEVELIAAQGAVLLARHQLAALIGEGPDATLDIKPAVGLKTTPIGLPAGLTADLIGRRPDIAAARLRVEAAAQKEKVARADFYPNVSLTGSITALAITPQDIVSHNIQLAQFGPAVSLPIFDGGRLAGAVRGARGDYEQAVANYDKAVVQALREVTDAITVRQGAQGSLDHANGAVAQSQEAYRLTRLRYDGGLSPYLSVLTAENGLVASRRQLADLQAQALSADVALVRALGGGFRDTATAAQQSNP